MPAAAPDDRQRVQVKGAHTMFRKMATAAVIAIAIAGPAWADDCSDRPGSLTCDEELRAAAELGISTGQVLA